MFILFLETLVFSHVSHMFIISHDECYSNSCIKVYTSSQTTMSRCIFCRNFPRPAILIKNKVPILPGSDKSMQYTYSADCRKTLELCGLWLKWCRLGKWDTHFYIIQVWGPEPCSSADYRKLPWIHAAGRKSSG